MRSFDEDFDDLDEFEFASFAATRRLLRDKQSHFKSADRKFRKNAHKDRWENDTWDPLDDFDDYDEIEFDKYQGIKLDD